MYTPDVVFVQVGIVDCAPRVISRKVENIISLLPGVRSGYRFLIKKLRRGLNRLYNLNYVSLDDFERNIKKINYMFDSKPVFFIPIFPASDEYERVLPGIKRNIKLYNSKIAKYKMVDYKCYQPESFTMSDYHHLNEKGHELIYKEVLNSIKSIRESND
jgi:lysophospholipase L1-like esterase